MAITTIHDDSDDELDVPLVQLTTTSPSETNIEDWETYVYIVSSHMSHDEDNEEEEDCKEDEVPTTKDVLGSKYIVYLMMMNEFRVVNKQALLSAGNHQPTN